MEQEGMTRKSKTYGMTGFRSSKTFWRREHLSKVGAAGDEAKA